MLAGSAIPVPFFLRQSFYVSLGNYLSTPVSRCLVNAIVRWIVICMTCIGSSGVLPYEHQ
jgi:hypothetical protein